MGHPIFIYFLFAFRYVFFKKISKKYFLCFFYDILFYDYNVIIEIRKYQNIILY